MAAVWTEELKAQVIADYLARNPTAETSTEIVKELAEEINQSANGVRMMLVQAKVYLKKEVSTDTKAIGTKTASDKAPRVSKEASIAALTKIIEDAGHVADEDVLSKLTGKAAVYFAGIIS